MNIHTKATIKEPKMNKTEAAYAMHLELMRRAGEILFYKFEPFKLRLAGKTFYTPDFLVVDKNNVAEVHEVKGFWRDDARVKIKVANENFPFKFIAISRGKRNSWEYEYF